MMIDTATGMRPGERYAVENLERTPNFSGFFLDGKDDLGPELMTAVGWLEGQTFIYDELDATGEPVFPNRARVDLVHCQEVVEHIEERYLDNLLESMCAGRFILMTNALPGQGGHHHVNEQPTEYWIHHLAERGCQVMVEDTKRVRKLAARAGMIVGE